ncbi:MAG: response regulator transcription factor [Deltaproteobacteria bacterium]|nr:MAG: response regulator transcription factor [Deltaproteobacteria bacterium]
MPAVASTAAARVTRVASSEAVSATCSSSTSGWPRSRAAAAASSAVTVRSGDRAISRRACYHSVSALPRRARPCERCRRVETAGAGSPSGLQRTAPLHRCGGEMTMAKTNASHQKARAPEERPTIRLLLVDDHPLVREGLKRVLSSMVGVFVVGEASTGEDAIARVRDLEPDIVMMDLSLPKMSGIEATRIIRKDFPQTRVLALTMHMEEVYVRGALEAGASGYLVKDARPNELVRAIETVQSGEPYVMTGAAPKLR